MVIVKTIKELDAVLANLKTSREQQVGLVPTMGALHDGHLSLIKRCRAENDIAVVSVFVNPTQFNNPTDLATYPRDLEKDAALVQQVGVDVLFAPSPEDVYTSGELENRFSFDFKGLDKVMEGKQRPGHFNGVVQIVSKLFKLVKPQKAYFGEKDFQQIAVIRLMVRTMQFPVQIISCPIIRENTGLAKSSRNQLLTSEEKEVASNIYKVLSESLSLVSTYSPQQLTQWVIEHVNSHKPLQVEYYEIVDGNTLQTIDNWSDADYIVGCITVQCNKVRLIDNITIKQPNA